MDVAATLNCNAGGREGHLVQAIPIQEAGGRSQTSVDNTRYNIGIGNEGDPMYCLTKSSAQRHGIAQPIAFSSNMSVPDCQEDVSPTLKLGGHGGGNPPAVAQPIPLNSMNCFRSPDADKSTGCGIGEEGEAMYTLTKTNSHAVMQQMAVRRLTPVECERLQGFPDNYTNIKEKCPDGPRYKALGNSMAVPVMRWIGQRIQAVNDQR